MPGPHDLARRAAERVARDSHGRLIASLCARTRDLAAAQDALADAFAAALQQWAVHGVPDNPAAWLLTVARRRQIDGLRRWQTAAAGAAEMLLLFDEAEQAPDEIPDRHLALMFACADPAIDRRMHAPLMLQAILGLTGAQIAQAFLVPPDTMSKRLVRAKAQIRSQRTRLRIPEPAQWPARLGHVLAAIYAAYTRGWIESGDAAPAPLADEAIWLARLAAGLLPEQPEALALLALMLFTDARRQSRCDAQGAHVPLAEQDPAGWDLARIDEAQQLLLRASAIGATGRYQIEAAIQSAHVTRRLRGVANQADVAALYELLFALLPSPVVALNRAMARVDLDGPEATLAALDRLGADRRMNSYQPYWATRAHLCHRLGQHGPARAALTLAIGLCSEAAQRRHLQALQEQWPPA